MPFGIFIGMKNAKANMLNIDRAGRMVIPQEVRRQFGLHFGSKMELDTTGDAIVLRPVDEKPALTMEDGLYIHEGIPEYGTLSDEVSFSREQRNRAVWGNE